MSNLKKIKAVYEGFAKGDIPGVLEVFSRDIEWTEAEGLSLWRHLSWSKGRARRSVYAFGLRVERICLRATRVH